MLSLFLRRQGPAINQIAGDSQYYTPLPTKPKANASKRKVGMKISLGDDNNAIGPSLTRTPVKGKGGRGRQKSG